LFERARRLPEQGAYLIRLRQYFQRWYGWLHGGLRGRVGTQGRFPRTGYVYSKDSPLATRPRPHADGLGHQRGHRLVAGAVISSLTVAYSGLGSLCPVLSTYLFENASIGTGEWGIVLGAGGYGILSMPFGGLVCALGMQMGIAALCGDRWWWRNFQLCVIHAEFLDCLNRLGHALRG
jgi:hypothetical protein